MMVDEYDRASYGKSADADSMDGSDGGDGGTFQPGTEQDQNGDDQRSKAPKKKRKGREPSIDGDIIDRNGNPIIDPRLWEVSFPTEFDAALATAIFELGLKDSSPKVLMTLMPGCVDLSTEHLKSHLQKYRIHHERSKEEFVAFFSDYMRDNYSKWERSRGWERAKTTQSNPSAPSSSSSMISSSSSQRLKRTESDSSEGAESSSKSVDSSSTICGAFSVMGTTSASAGASSSALSNSNLSAIASMGSGTGAHSPSGGVLKRPKGPSTKSLVQQSQQILHEWRSQYEDMVKESEKLAAFQLSLDADMLPVKRGSEKDFKDSYGFRDRGGGDRDRRGQGQGQDDGSVSECG
jgi:hypothetical protein